MCMLIEVLVIWVLNFIGNFRVSNFDFMTSPCCLLSWFDHSVEHSSINEFVVSFLLIRSIIRLITFWGFTSKKSEWKFVTWNFHTWLIIWLCVFCPSLKLLLVRYNTRNKLAVFIDNSFDFESSTDRTWYVRKVTA